MATIQQSNLLEEDVATWLVKQDSETKRHVNELIRQAMALRTLSFA